jgi:indole-3-glycerol phosphate synthase
MRTAAPDLLLRIAERRREHLTEYRRGHPEAAAEAPPPPPRAAVTAAAVVSAATQDVATPASGEPAAREVAAPQPLLPRDNPFLAALAHPHRAAGAALPGGRAAPAIIAEVKMGSPRIGSLVGRVDPLAQARLYAEHGAAALSVVVEPDFFHGSYPLLADCCAASGLPAIAKDFVVDPLQLAWARQAGADAVLLIAALYEPDELVRYVWLARGLGLAPLVEIHDPSEVALLAGHEWELVGINNRDLRTFEVDLERSIALLPSLPPAALKVAESGIRDARDVALLAGSGFDALLIGESLLLAGDPAAHLRGLFGGTEAAGA